MLIREKSDRNSQTTVESVKKIQLKFQEYLKVQSGNKLKESERIFKAAILEV